jgi:ParB-like chromosome segregation protein Spo0J
MREWGWTNPVLVDDAGMIIAGHGRVLAAAALGIPEVPVMVAEGWTEVQKRAYVLADNKLALNAEWDADFLKDEMAALGEGGFDFLTTGFSTEEFEAMFKVAQPPEGFAQYGENIATEHACPKCGFKWSGKTS